jgi:gamma-glutamyltranspeptidase/glutathione hydrolase
VTHDVDGREQPYMSFGLMGGSMQAQGHVQLLLDHFVFGMDIQQAIDAARCRHLDGLRLSLEPPIGEDVRAALRTMGHDIVPEDSISFGGAQAIIRGPSGYSAGSDPRKDGMAVGW